MHLFTRQQHWCQLKITRKHIFKDEMQDKYCSCFVVVVAGKYRVIFVFFLFFLHCWALWLRQIRDDKVWTPWHYRWPQVELEIEVGSLRGRISKQQNCFLICLWMNVMVKVLYVYRLVTKGLTVSLQTSMTLRLIPLATYYNDLPQTHIQYTHRASTLSS